MTYKYIFVSTIIFLSGCDTSNKAIIDTLEKSMGTYIAPKVLSQAEAGDAWAQYEIGNIYIEKARQNKDWQEKMEFAEMGLAMLEKSAASKNIHAMYRLASLYGYRQGEELARGGELCSLGLGYCYDSQKRIGSDKYHKDRSIKFLMYAAEQGHLEASVELTHIFPGYNPNDYWTKLAAKNGDPISKQIVYSTTAQGKAKYISGREAGRDWAIKNGITDEADCDGDSQSFNDGCSEQVLENLEPIDYSAESDIYDDSVRSRH